MPSLTQAQTNAVEQLLRISGLIDQLGHLFEDAGHRLYLVGGSVRDALLGHLGHDLDFTTSARPDQIEALLRSWTKAVWDIGKDFGTIGARRRSQGVDWQIEITTFRADVYRSDSRKPEVAFGDTLEGDLIRRDFTVNAMAVDVLTRRFVDPYNGLKDLAAGVLRPVLASFGLPALTQRASEAMEIVAWLGPCIGPQAFEVGPDVRSAFLAARPEAAAAFAPCGADKWLADLAALARLELRALGVMQVSGNDGRARWCTVGNPSRFFSHRRDTRGLGGRGRFAACVWIE